MTHTCHPQRHRSTPRTRQQLFTTAWPGTARQSWQARPDTQRHARTQARMLARTLARTRESCLSPCARTRPGLAEAGGRAESRRRPLQAAPSGGTRYLHHHHHHRRRHAAPTTAAMMTMMMTMMMMMVRNDTTPAATAAAATTTRHCINTTLSHAGRILHARTPAL